MINDSRSEVSEQRSVNELGEVGSPYVCGGVLRCGGGAICKSPYAGVCDRGQ